MKTKLFKTLLVAIGLLATSLTTQIWALTDGTTWYEGNQPYLYFNNINAGYNGVSLVMGRQWTYGSGSAGSQGYAMTAITNTKLYYTHVSLYDHYTTQCFVDRNGGSGWNDYSSTAVASRVTTYAHNYTNSYNLTYTSNKVYVFTAASSSKDASLTKSVDAAASYSNLNYTITVKAKVSTDGGSSYSEATSPGTLSASSYKFTAYNSCASAQSLSSGTISCGYTATTTLTAADATGYDFVGWYNSSGTQQTTNKTLTIYPTAAATYYAYYKEKRFTVSFANDGHGSTTPSSNQTVGQITGVAINATPNSGYSFSTWTITSGSGTFASAATTASNTFYPTANTTLTASFNEDLTYYTVTYGAGSSPYNNGTVSAANTSTSAAISSGASVLSGTGVTFTATPSNTHYKVAGWYSDATCTSEIAGAGTGTTYSTTISATTNVYAKFIIKTCDISLNKNGGTSNSSVTATHGSTLPSFTAVTRTGYTLTGYWTSSNGGTKIIDANGALVASTDYADANKKWNNDATTLTLYARWTENKTSVTLAASPAGAGTFTIGGAAATSTSAGVTTKPSVTAVPQPGYRVNTSATVWTKNNSNITLSSTTTNPTTVTGCGTASTSSTLTATFTRTYAYLEGRMTVYNSSRNTETHIGASKGAWADGSTNVKMDYDNTNHRFYRHTYKTPNELKAQQSNNDQWFYVKVSQADGSLTNAKAYHPSGSNGEFSGAGYANKIAAPTTTATYNFKINATTTNGYAIIYFDESHVWYELEHTLAYSANGGSGSAPASKKYYDNGATPTVLANKYTRTGYTFSKWNTKANGTGTDKVADETITMTANTILYAQWTPNEYTVTLDLDEDNHGTIAGKTTSQDVTYDAATTTVPDLPTGATGYGLDGYYTDHNGVGTKVINGDGTWIASVPNYTDADKKWIHDGDVTLYAYYKTAEITALTLSQAIVAPNTSGITVTPTIAPTPTGTVNVRYEIQYSNGTALSPQPSKSVSNKILTFTAPAASATYRVQATLYLTSDNTELHTTYTTFQVAGDHTVTIQYKCDDAVIKASTTVTGKPLAWSDAAIEAPTITGYTFARWEAGEGVSLTDDNGTTTKTTTTSSSIKIKATYNGVLTAVYTKKDIIYFNNANVGWDQVYVYFYDNGDYWEHVSGKGIGAQYDYAISNHSPHWWHFWGAMTRIEGTDIWYFDYQAAAATINPEHASLINNYTHVAFTQDAQGYTDAVNKGYEYFYATKAAYRTDFNHGLPMYVPLNANTVDKNVSGGAKTTYYNTGYWMNYPENTGYTLRIYDDPLANNSTGAVKEIPFPFSSDKKMPWKTDVEFNFTGQAWFMIYRNDGQLLGKSYTMKQEYHETALDVGSNQKIEIKTSAEGVYKFTLSFLNIGTEVSPNYKYYIYVEYPVGIGDYRIKYNDRAAWSGAAHDSKWWHASEIIRKNTGETEKADTVSLYVAYGSTPSAKFQKVTAIDNNTGVVTWEDVASGSVSLSGITKKGVYNFIVSQPAGGASISLTKKEAYTGDYYIRTDCAGDTKWDNYKALDHHMTYSDYAKDYSYAEAAKRYTHYYAHWVTSGTNVKFCIANDYSQSISDTIAEDYGTTIANITSGGTLESGNANIRFMWHQETNKISRAYISGSGGITDRFLVLEGDARMYDEGGHALTGTYQDHDKYGNYLGTDNQVILHDDENFVYERTIKVNATARAKLTAKYNDNIQYFKGSAGTFADGTTVQLLGGTYSAGSKYLMRIIYDFKTNRLVTAYMPEGEVSDPTAINADLMVIREHQEDGQQLIFTDDGSLSAVKSVYGVMRFSRWTLNNREKTGEHALLADPKSPYERALYWISFPFDVNLSDVFGFGTYGVDWIIEYYDGTSRAQKGYWKDSPSFWEYVLPSQRATYKLKAGQGYVLALDLDRMKHDNTDFWVNNIEQIELFFPSASTTVGNITATDVTTTVASHACTIDRTGNDGDDINKNRTKADSHWNMIGVPSYANYGKTLTTDGSTGITWNVQWSVDPYVYNLPYLYEWNMVDNTYTVQSGTKYPFKAMYAYMVQYAGELHWSLASATPSSIVARRTYADEPKEVEFRLELQQNEKMVDQTFVKLSEKEEVSADFAFDEDLCKELNESKSNIYTIVENYLPTAGNILPMSDQTTVVPVGVEIKAEGEYVFSVPDGTEGVGLTLVDTETGTRTNLALADYSVTLPAGTYDERFVLEISPIEQIVTGVEMINGDEQSSNGDASLNGVCKKLIDGVLYIVKDGKVFDARGARIQ